MPNSDTPVLLNPLLGMYEDYVRFLRKYGTMGEALTKLRERYSPEAVSGGDFAGLAAAASATAPTINPSTIAIRFLTGQPPVDYDPGGGPGEQPSRAGDVTFGRAFSKRVAPLRGDVPLRRRPGALPSIDPPYLPAAPAPIGGDLGRIAFGMPLGEADEDSGGPGGSPPGNPPGNPPGSPPGEGAPPGTPDWLKGLIDAFLKSNPEAAFASVFGPLLSGPSRGFGAWLQGQYEPYKQAYMGSLATNPSGSFLDYLKAQDPVSVFKGLDPRARGERPDFMAPRLRWDQPGRSIFSIGSGGFGNS